MGECVNGWTTECVNKWLREWVNEWMREWVKESASDWANEWMREGVNHSINEWVNDWMCEWVNELMSEWVHVWVSERARQRASKRDNDWVNRCVRRGDERMREQASEKARGWGKGGRAGVVQGRCGRGKGRSNGKAKCWEYLINLMKCWISFRLRTSWKTPYFSIALIHFHRNFLSLAWMTIFE